MAIDPAGPPFPSALDVFLPPTDPVYYPLPNVSYPPAVSPDPPSYNHHTELYVHHYHVQYQIVKYLKVNRLHHQPVGKSSHKSKTTKQPNYLKIQRGWDILSLL